LVEAKVKTGGALVKAFEYDGLGRVIGERYDTDATAGVGAGDPWYFKAYDGFSRHVATFRDTDASPKEIYTHHEMNDGGSQLALRRDVDATGGGGWGGSSDGVLETATYMLHRANGDVIAVVTELTDTGKDALPGLLRERLDYVPGGDGAEPMRFSPADGYQIGGERGADGYLTGDDYNAFIADFAAGTANGATDLNNNGVVDAEDFAAWNAEWDSGAPLGRAVMSAPDGADGMGPGNVRGVAAAEGLALDAQLSGKVAGADGVTGRVNYVPRPANLDVASGGGGAGTPALSTGPRRRPNRMLPFPPCDAPDRESQCWWWARNRCSLWTGPLSCHQACVEAAAKCCIRRSCSDPMSAALCQADGAQAHNDCWRNFQNEIIPPLRPFNGLDCTEACSALNAIISALCKTCKLFLKKEWPDLLECTGKALEGVVGCISCCQADGVNSPIGRYCIDQRIRKLMNVIPECLLSGAIDKFKEFAYRKRICEWHKKVYPNVPCPLDFVL
jgi:hypothetical protein